MFSKSQRRKFERYGKVPRFSLFDEEVRRPEEDLQEPSAPRLRAQEPDRDRRKTVTYNSLMNDCVSRPRSETETGFLFRIKEVRQMKKLWTGL